MNNNQPSINIKIPENLPIFKKRREIIQTICKNQVVVISGETGSGKSTVLPLLCIDSGCLQEGRIGITQPRRIATISLAHYVSSLIQANIDNYVGFKVRFHDQVSDRTRIKFITDGILLAELASDPLLNQYNAIIIDEAHERSCNIDFLLGYFRTLLPKRPNLKLIISSATLDTKLFSQCFHHAPIIEVMGRGYPVQVLYKPLLSMWEGERVNTYLEYVIEVIDDIVSKENDGDILLFLPTVQDIIETVFMLKNKYLNKSINILSLYSSMQVSDQKKIFKHYPNRKIVVATNIAETSLTVPGIRFVIDTGLARVMRYESSLHTSKIPVERISRSSANQRAGRCGRVSDGVCIRLFSENDFNSRPLFETTEIKRSNIAGLILRMNQLKLSKIERFPFLQRPNSGAIKEAYRQLRVLGALDSLNKITPFGREMAKLPLDPPIACMLLIARKYGAIREVSIIASALSVEDPRLEKHQFTNSNNNQKSREKSDFLVFIHIWNGFQQYLLTKKYKSNVRNKKKSFIQKMKEKRFQNKMLFKFCLKHNLSFHRMREWLDVHEQITVICKRIGGFGNINKFVDYNAIHKSLLCGLIENIAIKQSNGLYRGIYNHDISLLSSSVLKKKEPKWIVIHEVVETKRIYARTVASIKPKWIEQLFPRKCINSYSQQQYDPQTGMIGAIEKVDFRGMPLVENRYVNYSQKQPEHAHKIFIREVLVKRKVEIEYKFLNHNQKIRDEINVFENKLRCKEFYVGDIVLESFYEEKLPGVTSIRSLNNIISQNGNERFLFMSLSDLITKPIPPTIKEYPDEITIGQEKLSLKYKNSPDSSNDGVTVTVPLHLFEAVPIYYWEWLLPVFWRSRIEEIIMNLSNSIESGLDNKSLIVETLLNSLSIKPYSFLTALSDTLKEKFGLLFEKSDYNILCLSTHLWIRVSVVNEQGSIIDEFRPPFSIPKLKQKELSIRHPFWIPYCREYERSQILDWDFGILPQNVEIGSANQDLILPALRALYCDQESVGIRVFFNNETAFKSHALGIQLLLEQSIASKLAWEIHSLKLSEDVIEIFKPVINREVLYDVFHSLFTKTVLELPKNIPHDKTSFSIYRINALQKLNDLPLKVVNLFISVSEEYKKCIIQLGIMKKRSQTSTLYQKIMNELEKSLNEYITNFFSSNFSISLVNQVPRYLKAFRWRIETGHVNPARYTKCMKKLNNFYSQFSILKDLVINNNYSKPKELEELIDMIEEYAISLFAHQKVKTRFSISESKVQQKINNISQSCS